MPVSIITLRIKYAPINDLVEALYLLPNYFNSIHMLRFWGGPEISICTVINRVLWHFIMDIWLYILQQIRTLILVVGFSACIL